MALGRARYHLVFATKGRRPFIDENVEKFLYPVLGGITKKAGGKLVRVGGIEDHIHLICGIPPKIAVSDFVKDLKSQSTGALKREFHRLWHFKWQVSFGYFTLDPLNMKRVIDYVDNQKEHHRKEDLWEPYEVLNCGENHEERSGA